MNKLIKLLALGGAVSSIACFAAGGAGNEPIGDVLDRPGQAGNENQSAMGGNTNFLSAHDLELLNESNNGQYIMIDREELNKLLLDRKEIRGDEVAGAAGN